jgi:hypothetical protein
MFHTETSTVEIDDETAADKNRFAMVLAHESAHLCMAKLTNGLSNTEPFRFFDEGFANIVGGQFVGGEKVYRARALAAASQNAAKDGISFDRIQKWSTYFGDPPDADWDAYLVGSSFIFFIQDTYGQQKLLTFFKEIGRLGNLNAALQAVFHQSATTFQKSWLVYLRTHKSPSQ